MASNVTVNDGYFCVKFDGIKKYSDISSFWATKSRVTGVWNIRKQFLRNALAETSTYESNSDGDGSKKVYYTDVIMKIPETSFRQLERGQREKSLIELQNSLQDVHIKAFSGEFLNNSQPSYIIVSDNNMASGCAEFYFGNRVFVPNENDKLLFELELMFGDSKIPLNWSNGKAAAFYERQVSGFQMGNTETPFVIHDNIWQGNDIIITPCGEVGNEEFQIYFDDNHATPSSKIVMKEKNEETTFIESIDSKITIKFTRVHPLKMSEKRSAIKDSNSTQENISNLEGNSLTKADFNSKDKGTFIPTTNSDNSGDTFMPKISDDEGRTFMRTTRIPELKLVGIMLPRIDKIESVDPNDGSPAYSWTLKLNEKGKCIDSNENVMMSITAKNDKAFLLIEDKFNEGIQKLDTTNQAYNGNVPNVQILPTPDINDGNLFWGILNTYKKESIQLIPNKTIICGRATGNGNNNTNFNLLLMEPAKIVLKNKRRSNKTDLDSLYTSRKHIEATLLDNDCLQIKQISTSRPIFLLRDDNTLIEKIDNRPKNYKQLSDEEKETYTTVIENGQKIIMGSTLLQFDNGKI